MNRFPLACLVLLLLIGCDTASSLEYTDDPATRQEPLDVGALAGPDDPLAPLFERRRTDDCQCTTRSRGRMTLAVGEAYQFLERLRVRGERDNHALGLLRLGERRLLLGVFVLKGSEPVCRLDDAAPAGQLVARYVLDRGRRVQIDELNTTIGWPHPRTTSAQTQAVLDDVTLFYNVDPIPSTDPRPNPQPKPKPFFICGTFEVDSFTG